MYATFKYYNVLSKLSTIKCHTLFNLHAFHASRPLCSLIRFKHTYKYKSNFNVFQQMTVATGLLPVSSNIVDIIAAHNDVILRC